MGFRNNAAADSSCHSNGLLQQMDEGWHFVQCLYLTSLCCISMSLFVLLQRWPTVQDLAAATLEVMLIKSLQRTTFVLFLYLRCFVLFVYRK